MSAVMNQENIMSLAESYPSHDPDWVAEVHATQYLQSWSKQGAKPRVITGGEGGPLSMRFRRRVERLGGQWIPS